MTTPPEARPGTCLNPDHPKTYGVMPHHHPGSDPDIEYICPPEPVEARDLPTDKPYYISDFGTGPAYHPYPKGWRAVPPEPVEARDLTAEARAYEHNVMDTLDHRLPPHTSDCDEAWTSGRCLRCDVVAGVKVAFGFSRALRAEAARPSERLREAARRVVEVVDEPTPVDDGTIEVEALWYLEWEGRHREAVEALRAALDQPRSGEATPNTRINEETAR